MTMPKAAFSIAFVISQFALFLPAQADTLGILSLDDEQPQTDDTKFNRNQ
ncbi:hypothetical protein [Marinobacter fonticola]|nr:hypothetical protein [Marinobacter fonticola]